MKKKVTKIEVVDYVAERGERKGQKGQYVVLTLANRGNNWIASVNKNEERLTITRPQSVVDLWTDFAKQLTDGKTVEQVVPDEFRLIDNVFKVNVPLGEKCYRLYRKKEVDKATGKTLHEAGDIHMLDDGKTPAIYDSVEVLAVKYEDDDTGEMCWLQEPSSIVRDMMNRGYYRPVTPNAVSEAETIEAGASEAAEANAPEDGGEKEPTLEELEAKLAAMKGQQQGA